MENVKARLSWLSSGGVIGPTAAIEQSQTLAKRATWMATHLDTAEWSAISQQAIKLSADFTAGTRWQTAIGRIKALKERCGEEEGEGGCDLDILAERVSEACIACAGVVASAEDQEMLVVAGRHCLYSDWCTPNVAAACQHVMSFVSTSKYIPEHAWLATVVAGLALARCVDTASKASPDLLKPYSSLKLASDAFDAAAERCVQAFGKVHDPELVPVWALILGAAGDAARLLATLAAKIADGLKEVANAKLSILQGVLIDWKGKLSEKPVWADITREIAYHFWRAPEGGKKTPSEVLEEAYTGAEVALQAYTKACASMGAPCCTDVTSRAAEVCVQALVLNTEEYMVRQVEQQPTRAQQKLTQRLRQITDKFDYTKIHPTIRTKVFEITGM